jgi:hypothetical protein
MFSCSRSAIFLFFFNRGIFGRSYFQASAPFLPRIPRRGRGGGYVFDYCSRPSFFHQTPGERGLERGVTEPSDENLFPSVNITLSGGRDVPTPNLGSVPFV